MKNTTRTLNFAPAYIDNGVKMAALLTLKVGKDVDTYGVEPIKSEIGGAAFAITRLDIVDEMPVYHVRFMSAKVVECDCPGGTYRGKCKHADAVAKLIELGKLPGPAPKATPIVDESELFESL